MSKRSAFDEYESESQVQKLIKKSKDSPFVPLGMAGFFGVAGMGIYNFRNRGSTSASVYLMQLRVVAQGTVVGALCLGLIYSMGERYYNRTHPSTDANSSSSSRN